jgi:hypothetical protein
VGGENLLGLLEAILLSQPLASKYSDSFGFVNLNDLLGGVTPIDAVRGRGGSESKERGSVSDLLVGRVDQLVELHHRGGDVALGEELAASLHQPRQLPVAERQGSDQIEALQQQRRFGEDLGSLARRPELERPLEELCAPLALSGQLIGLGGSCQQRCLGASPSVAAELAGELGKRCSRRRQTRPVEFAFAGENVLGFKEGNVGTDLLDHQALGIEQLGRPQAGPGPRVLAASGLSTGAGQFEQNLLGVVERLNLGERGEDLLRILHSASTGDRQRGRLGVDLLRRS